MSIEWKSTKQWDEPAFEAQVERFQLRAYRHPQTGYGYVVEHESDGYDANGEVATGHGLVSLDAAKRLARIALREYLTACLRQVEA